MDKVCIEREERPDTCIEREERPEARVEQENRPEARIVFSGRPVSGLSRRVLDREAIKMIAVLAMTFNHVGHTFAFPFRVKEGLLDAGYFTAVTMVYFLVEGFFYTRSLKKYALRLLAFGLLAEWPFLKLNAGLGNMLFSILLCLGILTVQEYIPAGPRQRVFTAVLVIAQAFTDWPLLAAAFTFLFYRAKKERDDSARPWISAFILFFLLEFFGFLTESGALMAALRAFLAALPILASAAVIRHLYNGKRAAHARGFFKWFFYLYYPLHLWLLVFLRDMMAAG